MKFRPLYDCVLVRRIEKDTKTVGGIIIPDVAIEKPREAEVLAIGTGTRDENGRFIPPEVKVGDRVLFSKWSGTEVAIDGEKLLVIRESDIIGFIESSSSTVQKQSKE